MLFDHLKVNKADFKELLSSKHFKFNEIPIVDDYFSLDPVKEKGYIILVEHQLSSIIGLIFSSIKKSQSATIMPYIEDIVSVSDKNIPFSIPEKTHLFFHNSDKVVVYFIFKDSKISVIIKDLLHIIIDDTDVVNLSISGFTLSFKDTLRFDKFLQLLHENNKAYFERNYDLPYTVENIANIKKIINTKYNINAVNYQDSVNKKYNQTKIAQHMNEHYVGVMLSSVVNNNISLSLLVTEPTVDMSRKLNSDGKFSGCERITFPVNNLNKAEKLFDHILINEWSKQTLQMVNAMILYQSAINGVTIKHVSVVMPKLYEDKKNLSSFELFNVVSEADVYFDNQQHFKIIFGLNIKIQVKDGIKIVYDHEFKTLDEAYVHFIDYFRKRIIKKIPSSDINNNTFKLLSMINI
jgi:hypothetical protein